MIQPTVGVAVLAQMVGNPAAVSPSIVRDVVVVVSFVMGVVALAWQTWARRPQGPTDGHSVSNDCVTTRAHETDRAEMLGEVRDLRREMNSHRDTLTAELRALERRVADENSRRDANTHERINDLVKGVASLAGEVKGLSEYIRGDS